MIDIIADVYNKFMDEEQEKNRVARYLKEKSYLHSSSAGRCAKLHKYDLSDIEGREEDFVVKSNMRHGTIVHNDIESSIGDWKYVYDKYGVTLLTETEFKSRELLVKTYIDLMILYNNKSLDCEIAEFKTTPAYKWKLLFGLKKNRDANTDENYKLQVGTQGYIAREYGFNPTKLSIIYYNKNTSQMRERFIPLSYIEEAEKYWRDVIKILNNNDLNDLKQGMPMIPMEKWECGKYCKYSTDCIGYKAK